MFELPFDPSKTVMPEVASLLDVIKEPAAIISLNYEILACNQAYRTVYGEKQKLLGRSCFEVSHGYSVPCDQAGESCPLKRCLESGQRQRVLHLHNTPHGEEHVDVEMNPIRNDQGELIGYLEIMHWVKEARATPGEGGGMVGRSPAFSRMLEMLRRAAPSDITVLLLGASGSGKELAAKALHDGSSRARGPFITVECSGLTESLFESELFGHERGAFTGAVGRKKGLIEAARGGTLFLDEIGEIPLPQQVKLLRLIETGTYRTVGGIEPQHADFRLVCATHRNLKQMVDDGQFRQDLYYRISAFPIGLPSLAERVEDLELLIEALMVRLPDGNRYRLTEAALSALRGYAFPGNIRELRNILERGMLLADDDLIGVEHLPADCQDVASTQNPSVVLPQGSLDDIVPLDQLEKCYLQRITADFKGDNRSLAERLGVSERTLYRKLSRLK